MNIEGVSLCKKASHKRTNTVWSQLYNVPRVIKFIEPKSRVRLPKAEVRGEWRAIVQWVQNLFSKIKWVLQESGGGSRTTMWIGMPLTLYLKMVKVDTFIYTLPQFKNAKIFCRKILWIKVKDKTYKILGLKYSHILT